MKKILYTALGALMLTACQKEATDLPMGNYPEDGVVRIIAQVNDPITRATTSEFTGTDLSLSIEPQSGNSTYNYNNIKWTSADNGATWSPASQMLWEGANQMVNISAYAPHVAGVTDITAIPFTIGTNQTSGVVSSDLLGFFVQGYQPYVNNHKFSILLTFNHILSKLTLAFTLGSQFDGENLTITSVKLLGTNTAVVYNAKDKTVKDAASVAIAPISMMRIDNTNSYTAILAPQMVIAGSPMIEVTLSNGSTYRYTAATGGHTFATGTAYTMNLKIGKDKITIDGNVAVTDWGTDTDNPFEGGGEADVVSDITGFTVDGITDEAINTIIASYVSNGKLKLTGSFGDVPKDAHHKFSKIAAYIREHKDESNGAAVTALDFNKTTGITTIDAYSYGVGPGAYYDCSFMQSALVTVNLPASIIYMSNAFQNCTALTTVTGGENVTDAMRAFNGCTSLTTAPHLPQLSVLLNTFTGSGLTAYSSDVVTKLNGQTFSYCAALTSVSCPNAVYLNNWLFQGCSSLTDITLTAETFSYVKSFTSNQGTHLDTFTDIPNRGNVTLRLNASQKEKIAITGDACTWSPVAVKTDSNNTGMDKPLVLTGFGAIYCGNEKIYPVN